MFATGPKGRRLYNRVVSKNTNELKTCISRNFRIDASRLCSPIASCPKTRTEPKSRILEALSKFAETGRIWHLGRVYPGQHPPIITPELWSAVQTQLQARAAKPRKRTTKGRAARSPASSSTRPATG